jgi:hypothetical protein
VAGACNARFLALRIRPAGITPRRQAAAHAGGVGWNCQFDGCWSNGQLTRAEPVRYWLSNLPDEPPIVELVRLGKLR